VRRGGLIEAPWASHCDRCGDVGAESRRPAAQSRPRWAALRRLRPRGIGADTRVSTSRPSPEAGAHHGSGGLVVLDDSDCMVDIARYFLRFTQDQSCGKCTYCRVGTKRMLEILNRICEGQARRGDLEELDQLSRLVRRQPVRPGKDGANPVLSTLRYFRGEYEAHLEGRCPAGKCKALIAYQITDACIGCNPLRSAVSG